MLDCLQPQDHARRQISRCKSFQTEKAPFCVSLTLRHYSRHITVTQLDPITIASLAHASAGSNTAATACGAENYGTTMVAFFELAAPAPKPEAAIAVLFLLPFLPLSPSSSGLFWFGVAFSRVPSLVHCLPLRCRADGWCFLGRCAGLLRCNCCNIGLRPRRNFWDGHGVAIMRFSRMVAR